MKIQEQIKDLEDQIKELSIEKYQLEQEGSKEIKSFIAKIFDLHDILLDGDEIDGDLSSFKIKRPHPEYSYKKEMFTIYHDSIGWGDEDKDKFEATVNYYTGGATNDPWELKRLVTLGKVAELLENKAYYDQFNDGIADIKRNYRPEKNRILKERFAHETTVRELKLEEKRQKKEQFLQDLNQGVEFGEPVSFGNTSKTFNKVVGLKVTDITPSGKTAQLEITVKDWKGDIYTLNTKMKVESFEDLYAKPYTVS